MCHLGELRPLTCSRSPPAPMGSAPISTFCIPSLAPDEDAVVVDNKPRPEIKEGQQTGIEIIGVDQAIECGNTSWRFLHK